MCECASTSSGWSGRADVGIIIIGRGKGRQVQRKGLGISLRPRCPRTTRAGGQLPRCPRDSGASASKLASYLEYSNSSVLCCSQNLIACSVER